MKIYITRHGRTDWNDRNIVHGSTNISLNGYGIVQSKELKKILDDIRFDAIITSPLLRARQTAEIINHGRGIKMICEERLMERSYGIFEGTSMKEEDFLEFWNLNLNKKYLGTERMRVYLERVYDFLLELCEKRYNNVLLVTHAGFGLIAYIFFIRLPKRKEIKDYLLDNCEVICYDSEDIL